MLQKVMFCNVSRAYLEALRSIDGITRANVVENSCYEEEPNLPLRHKGRVFSLGDEPSQQINPQRVVHDGER
jgi:hypothetical protein